MIDPEEKAREAASNAYHDHPSHPSDCAAYEEHAKAMGRNSVRCPCEDDWRMFVEYVAGYVIRFDDGGDPEGQVLHRGTKEECEKARRLVDGVSYSGDRRVKGAEFFIVPASIYDTFQEGGGSA
jgi:hypothetical protein